MEDNEVMEASEELTADQEAAFDESWDEDAEADFGEEGDDSDDGPVTEDETGEHEEGQPDANHDEGTADDTEASEEPRAETETGNQRFKIKYNGAEEEYDLDEMTTLAQKGRDYDHVREERDGMKGKYGKYEGFLQKLADKAGVSIEEQIDLTEAMWLMDEEAEKGNTLTEAEALLRVQRGRNTPPAQAEETKSDTDKMIDRFLSVYPKVQATDIPKEVWDEAGRLGDLLTAYQSYEIKRLKEENEKAKQEARNEQNARRSTGPRNTSGSGHKRDAFDEGWDSE